MAADKHSIVTCWREPVHSGLDTGQKARQIPKSVLNYNLPASKSLSRPPERIYFFFSSYIEMNRILFTFHM